jgi:hypothetical protein
VNSRIVKPEPIVLLAYEAAGFLFDEAYCFIQAYFARQVLTYLAIAQA